MSRRKVAKEKNELVYLMAATTNGVARAYFGIEKGELRRSIHEEMKETKKETIRKERMAWPI